MADLTYGGDERELVTQRIRIQQKLAALGMTWEDIAPPTSLAPGAPAGVPRTLVAEPTLTPEQQITRASAQAFGGGPGDYDPSQGISATDRAQLGAFSDDNAEERMAALQRMYPGAQIAPVAEDVFGIKAPGAPVRYTNPPGVELGSLAQFGTQYGPEMVGGLGGAAAGALATPFIGPAAPVVGGATGAGLARGGRELVQKAFGTQRESAGDVAGQMAIAGGAELLGPVAKVAWNAVKSAGRAVAGKASASVVQEFMSKLSPDELTHAINVLNEKEGLNLPPLMVFQKYPDPIVEKVVKQVSQYSQEAQDRIAAQMDGLAKSSRGAIPTPAGTATSDELVQGMMAKDYKNTLQLRVPRSNPLGAGRAMGEGVQESIKAEKAAMGEQYNRLYGYLDENPHRFDLGPAQVSARARNIPGELSEDEIAQQIAAARLPDGSIDLGAIDEFINVAQPNEKLSRINSVLQRLEPEQDFHVIKELRTQAGSLMEMPLAQNVNRVPVVPSDLYRLI